MSGSHNGPSAALQIERRLECRPLLPRQAMTLLRAISLCARRPSVARYLTELLASAGSALPTDANLIPAETCNAAATTASNHASSVDGGLSDPLLTARIAVTMRLPNSSNAASSDEQFLTGSMSFRMEGDGRPARAHGQDSKSVLGHLVPSR